MLCLNCQRGGGVPLPRLCAFVFADDTALLIFAWFSGFRISSYAFLAMPSFAMFAMNPMIVSSLVNSASVGISPYPATRACKLTGIDPTR